MLQSAGMLSVALTSLDARPVGPLLWTVTEPVTGNAEPAATLLPADTTLVPVTLTSDAVGQAVFNATRALFVTVGVYG